MTSKALSSIWAFDIRKKDILAFSPIDLSFDGSSGGGYIKGYIFLTKKKLGVCTMELPSDYVVTFNGIKDGLNMDEPGEYEITFYDLEKLAHVHLDHYIGTNIVSAEYDGKELRIAAFTNRYQGEMNVFVRQLRGYLKGQEITAAEEDEEEEVAEEPKKNKRSIFGRTLKYFLKYKFQVTVLMLTYGVAAVISIAWPYLIGKVLFDHVLEKDDTYLAQYGLAGEYMLALLLVALVMIGCRLIAAISNYLQVFVMARVASEAVRDIKTDVFDAMSRLSLDFFVNKQTGGLMTRVLSDSEKVRDFFIDGLPMIFVHGITIIYSYVQA